MTMDAPHSAKGHCMKLLDPCLLLLENGEWCMTTIFHAALERESCSWSHVCCCGMVASTASESRTKTCNAPSACEGGEEGVRACSCVRACVSWGRRKGYLVKVVEQLGARRVAGRHALARQREEAAVLGDAAAVAHIVVADARKESVLAPSRSVGEEGSIERNTPDRVVKCVRVVPVVAR